jgi:hypothetical protein
VRRHRATPPLPLLQPQIFVCFGLLGAAGAAQNKPLTHALVCCARVNLISASKLTLDCEMRTQGMGIYIKIKAQLKDPIIMLRYFAIFVRYYCSPTILLNYRQVLVQHGLNFVGSTSYHSISNDI